MDSRETDAGDIEAYLKSASLPKKENLFEAGQVVKQWRLTAFLGKGGSGEVYRAEPIDGKGDAVAIKFLIDSETGYVRLRFMREISVLKEHSHRNLPAFIDSGEFNGHIYAVTELLEPYELPTTDKGIADFICNLSEGVAYLHALGLVHRDIKPSNIMSRNGVPVLIDLGLVKSLQQEIKIEDTISIVDGRAMGLGTPLYAAPEQFESGKVLPCSDVHALGVLIDQCFQNKPPKCWRGIIQKATSSIAAQRYKTVGDLVKAIHYRHLSRYATIGATVAILAFVSLVMAFKDRFALELMERNASHDYGKALEVEGQRFRSRSDNPWEIVKDPVYSGGAAVLSTGDEGGTSDTWLEMTLPEDAETMTVIFQKVYYNGRFAIEIDGAVKYSDQSISPPEHSIWIWETIDLPPGSKSARFIYEHPGVGFRNHHNGVCIDSIYFNEKKLSLIERYEALTNLVQGLKPVQGKDFYAVWDNNLLRAAWYAVMLDNHSFDKIKESSDDTFGNVEYSLVRSFLHRLNTHPSHGDFIFRLPNKEEREFLSLPPETRFCLIADKFR